MNSGPLPPAEVTSSVEVTGLQSLPSPEGRPVGPPAVPLCGGHISQARGGREGLCPASTGETASRRKKREVAAMEVSGVISNPLPQIFCGTFLQTFESSVPLSSGV